MYRIFSETYNYLASKGSNMALTGIIWAIAAGFGIGIIMSYYHKNYLGETVRRLYKKGADSEAAALTLKELGLSPTKLRTHALRDNGFLRKYIKIAENGSGDNNTLDFGTAKLYIPEELKYKAIVRFEQKSTIPVFLLVLSLIILAAIALGATFAAPKILKVLDNFLTSIIKK